MFPQCLQTNNAHSYGSISAQELYHSLVNIEHAYYDEVGLFLSVRRNSINKLVARNEGAHSSLCLSSEHSPSTSPPIVRIMLSLPSFSSIFLIYCKTSCSKHDVKLHNYALTITTTTRGTCLWSRYPVLVIIRELEVSTSRPSVAS